MNNQKITNIESVIYCAPLVACYAVFPACALIYRVFTDEKFPRQILDPFWILIFLALTIYSTAINRKRIESHTLKQLLSISALSFTLIILIFISLAYQRHIEMGVASFELKIPLYLAITALSTARPPHNHEKIWTRCGISLSAILLLDTAHQSIIYQSFSRAQGSGEVNYDALLIALSIGFTLKGDGRAKGINLAILTIGLLLTQSRTMLIAIIAAISAFSGISVAKKVTIIVAGLICATIIFEARGLEMSIEAVDRYWMWITGIDVLSDPLTFLTGYPLGTPFKTEIPEPVYDLWMGQTQFLSIQGVYSYNLHAFWLRFATNYGAPITTIVIGYILFHSLKTQDIKSRIIGVLIILSGFTMGTFYLANVSIPALMALASANKKQS